MTALWSKVTCNSQEQDSGKLAQREAKLRDLDSIALLGLLQDLYAASKENRAFLNARLNLGGDPLAPYKTVISRSICPDVFKNQTVSVAKAKRAITDYKKAIGHPEGMGKGVTAALAAKEALSVPMLSAALTARYGKNTRSP